MRFSQTSGKTKYIVMGSILLVVIIIGAFGVGNVVESSNVDEIMCIQSPVSGNLTWFTNAGLHWQGFGKVTKYRKRSQFSFSAQGDVGKNDKDESIKVRFNDGGHANLSGSISWAMPLDVEHLNKIQSQFGSQEAVEQQLVRPVLEKAVYMTGPLMSSKESAAERRNELLVDIEDQVQGGIYRTETVQVEVPDPLNPTAKKTVNVVQLKKDDKGNIARTDPSPLTNFGIQTFNPSLNQVAYDKDVEDQIKQQQALTMQVQTAMAESKTAEQRAITTKANGEADAAKAKWQQEVIKAQQVTEAEQKRDVAALDVQTAQLRKQESTLYGEGEGAKRAAIQRANGSLELKLKTYEEVQRSWADAVSRYPGNWVPTVIMGNNGNAPAGGAQQLIEMLNAKTAMDLGLSLKSNK